VSFKLSVYQETSDSAIWILQKDSDYTVHIEYAGPPLASNTRYYYKVLSILDNGEIISSNGTDYFETGILQENQWCARWINNPLLSDVEQCSIFRKEFSLEKDVKRARIYASAAGLYELYLNGAVIGDYVMAPGWSSYHSHIQYQCYDVTSTLHTGKNALGIRLGDGWYSGEFAFNHQTRIYGERASVMLQLMIDYDDGSTCIITDDTWKCSRGGVIFSGIYDGEIYDSLQEPTGWTESGYSDNEWQPAATSPEPNGKLVGQMNEGTKRIEEIKPLSIFRTPKGETVLDMGQNMVGWVKVKATGNAGDKIHLKHFEVLNENGNCYFDNIRLAKQETRYVLSGNGTEIFEPHFTFQGFRYIKIIDFPGEPETDNFMGIVLHTDMEQTVKFSCSNQLVNQLWHNIIWGQKGNFVDIPTDCPQRDERLGWTGDAQVFCRTASFNYLSDAFFTKWLADVQADQFPTGAIPFVVPNVLPKDWRFLVKCGLGYEHTTAGWGDAITICPWTLYQCYGDKRILEESYDSMRRYIAYIHDGCKNGSGNPYLWDWGPQLGDWLALDNEEGSYYGGTDEYLVATAFYAYSTKIVARCAEVLKKQEDKRYYLELYNKIVDSFKSAYMTGGKMNQDTQTAHILPLAFGLLNSDEAKPIAAKLVELIKANDYHLTTGFLGSPYLCPVLSDYGYSDIAYQLFMKKDFPSWLYQVTKGATTIWEHWDGIKEDGSFWSADMNSFNHYAYGSIGDWLYHCVAGIRLDENMPAYKHIIICPSVNPCFDHVSCKYESMYGEIISEWKLTDGLAEYHIQIPANTTATIELNSGDPVHVGSGHHHFIRKVYELDGH
jgi:alpha-L-rhamnosidase